MFNLCPMYLSRDVRFVETIFPFKKLFSHLKIKLSNLEWENTTIPQTQTNLPKVSLISDLPPPPIITESVQDSAPASLLPSQSKAYSYPTSLFDSVPAAPSSPSPGISLTPFPSRTLNPTQILPSQHPHISTSLCQNRKSQSAKYPTTTISPSPTTTTTPPPPKHTQTSQPPLIYFPSLAASPLTAQHNLQVYTRRKLL